MEQKRRKLTNKRVNGLENGRLAFAAKYGDFEDHFLCLPHFPQKRKEKKKLIFEFLIFLQLTKNEQKIRLTACRLKIWRSPLPSRHAGTKKNDFAC